MLIVLQIDVYKSADYLSSPFLRISVFCVKYPRMWDPITQLPNRRLFMDRLNQQVRATQPADKGLPVPMPTRRSGL